MTDIHSQRRIPLARPGGEADKARMDEILRVDHAGEYAAVRIYQAQRAVFEGRKGHAAVAADLEHMQAQEAAPAGDAVTRDDDWLLGRDRTKLRPAHAP